MRFPPLITLLFATVALANVPASRPPLTPNSQIIIAQCQRGAAQALVWAEETTKLQDYYIGYSNALLDASYWLQDYLPRE